MKKKPSPAAIDPRYRLQVDVPVGTRETLQFLTGLALAGGAYSGPDVRGRVVALALIVLHQWVGDSPGRLARLAKGEIPVLGYFPEVPPGLVGSADRAGKLPEGAKGKGGKDE